MATDAEVQVISDGRGPKYKVFNGFKLPLDFDKAEDSLSYVAKPNDLFIVTFPKCGTTWTQQITALILHNGEMDDGKVFDCCPFLEFRGKDFVESIPYPKAIKTHLPYDLQPKHEDAKYIVVLRNPKDAAVSFYHHHRLFPGYIDPSMTFSEYLKYFTKGEQCYGDYFDWILSWWPHRNDANVLFLLYEDMKSDIRTNILKIAEFIGSDYKGNLLDNDGEVLNKIIDRSSLKSMRKEINAQMKDSVHFKGVPEEELKDECDFVRKGIIGDWKNHFTVSENEAFNKHFHEKVDGTGIEFLWDNYHVFD